MLKLISDHYIENDITSRNRQDLTAAKLFLVDFVSRINNCRVFTFVVMACLSVKMMLWTNAGENFENSNNKMPTYLVGLFMEKIADRGIIMSITECRMRFLTDCQRVEPTSEAFTTEETENDSFSFLLLKHFILSVNKSYTRSHDTVSNVYEQFCASNN